MAVSTMLAASTGGHLDQLIRLRHRLGGLGEDVVWATFDTPQSRSRLADDKVIYVPMIQPRDYRALARSLQPARRILQRENVDTVVSTGSGIALSFMPMARAQGIDCHYVESAARSLGPSLTGRLLSRVHGVKLYTQHPTWADQHWAYAGSVFDGFTPLPIRERSRIRRIVVTLGMIKPYEFHTLIDRLLPLIPQDSEVLWQTGFTNASGRGIAARQSMPAHEMDAAMREADLVIAHAGIGSALSALEAGHVPILVPRRANRHEHIDDHQQQIAAELSRRDLAIAREVDELTVADLELASRASVERTASPPPLHLSLN